MILWKKETCICLNGSFFIIFDGSLLKHRNGLLRNMKFVRFFQEIPLVVWVFLYFFLRQRGQYHRPLGFDESPTQLKWNHCERNETGLKMNEVVFNKFQIEKLTSVEVLRYKIENFMAKMEINAKFWSESSKTLQNSTYRSDSRCCRIQSSPHKILDDTDSKLARSDQLACRERRLDEAWSVLQPAPLRLQHFSVKIQFNVSFV